MIVFDRLTVISLPQEVNFRGEPLSIDLLLIVFLGDKQEISMGELINLHYGFISVPMWPFVLPFSFYALVRKGKTRLFLGSL